MARIGYARVSSTAGQSCDIQIAQLRAAGCDIIRSEQVSGKSREGRDELATIMEFIHADDELCVVKLDRLGRSTRDVLNLVHELEQRGASLRVLEPAIDTAGPMGKVILTVLGMVAEMELSHIRARQRAGIDAARQRDPNLYRGRPASLDHAKVREMAASGVGATEIARAVGCSRNQVYKILRAA